MAKTITIGDWEFRERDWILLLIDDPNGPLLGTMGTVSGWDDNRVAVQTDDSGEAFWVPLKTIRTAAIIDGPVMMDVHVCSEHPVPYESDGALGHGFECGVCGNFLQAG